MAEVKDDTKEEVWLVLSGTARTNKPEDFDKLEADVRRAAVQYLTNTETDMAHAIPHNPTPEVIAQVEAMFSTIDRVVLPIKPTLSMVDLEARKQKSIENGQERRQQRFEKEYIVAEQVAAIPSLTASERCHAVIYGLKKLNDRERIDQQQQLQGDKVFDARALPNTAGEYGHFHDTMKFEDIEKGIHRSAASLFD